MIFLVQLKAFRANCNHIGLVRIQIIHLLINQIKYSFPATVLLKDTLASLLHQFFIEKWNDYWFLKEVPARSLNAFIREQNLLLPNKLNYVAWIRCWIGFW